jgi:histone-lysine N-methyltransferase SETMAR
MLNCDNAPIQNTERVQVCVGNFGFKGMDHPPYSPDLGPCDFFLFGAMKKHFAEQRCDGVDDLFQAVEGSPAGHSEGVFQTVFLEWIR